MKKIKHLLSATVCVLMAAVLVMATACGPKTPEVTETAKTLQSIEIDTTNVKTSYYVGEEFTSEGLVVTASFKDESGAVTTENVSSAAEVDSRAFDSSAPSEAITIIVSYTYEKTQYKEKSYTVSVVEARDGVDIVFLDGIVTGGTLGENKQSASVDLSEENPTVSIDVSKIEVRIPDSDGVVDYDEEALAATDYDSKVIKDKEVIEDTSALGAGVYEIWVYLDEKEDGFQPKNFGLVFVNDNVVGLEFNEEAEGTVTEQDKGEDVMSATWQFTVSYASQAEKTVYGDDDGVEISGLDTTAAAENAEATVTYAEANAEGVEKVTPSVTVTYTIVDNGSSEEATNLSIDFTDTTKIAANATLAGYGFTGLVAINDINGNATGFSVTQCGTSEKYTLIGTQNSVQCLQFQGSGTTEKNSIAATVGAGSVKITVSYFSGNVGRYVKVLNDGLDTATVAETELTTTDKSIKTRVIEFELTAETVIYLGSASSGIYVTYISIEVVPTEVNNNTTTIDFTDTTKIAANATLAGNGFTGLVAINDIGGNATGFSVTQCGTSEKYTLIGTQNSVQCLQFQGSGTTEKNSIAATVGAGSVKITVKYFNGNVGRYVKVLNDGLDTATVAETELTTTDKSIKTRVIEFELTAETVIYLGSASSGIYVTYISIEVL